MSANKNKKQNPQKNKQIPEENILVLQADDGENVRFELIDIVEYENNNYVVLLPIDEGDTNMYTILKLEEIDEETDLYSGIEDEELIQAVFEEFKKREC